MTSFDVCFCVDFILFLANSISTQYFPQFDTFYIIGITQNSVISFGLQFDWLISTWNAASNETDKKTRIHWLDQQIVSKQLGIMPTYHYVQNQGKLMMQSRENWQKSQFRQLFDGFEVTYLQIANFSEK